MRQESAYERLYRWAQGMSYNRLSQAIHSILSKSKCFDGIVPSIFDVMSH